MGGAARGPHRIDHGTRGIDMGLSITDAKLLTAVSEAPPAVFGARPSNEKPHSMNLCGQPEERQTSRAADVLVGIGIGALAMYLLMTADASRGVRSAS
jgi:hypothetical protein